MDNLTRMLVQFISTLLNIIIRKIHALRIISEEVSGRCAFDSVTSLLATVLLWSDENPDLHVYYKAVHQSILTPITSNILTQDPIQTQNHFH